jgi:pimeloyl-ACP methyl ester carboxylesterase
MATAFGAFVPGGARLAPLTARLIGRVGDLSDLATTIEAEDAFDLASCSGTIEAPTLIVAGGRDRFYDRGLLADTARLIPRSTLHVFPRRGHITVTFDPRYAPLVKGFLTR